MELDWNDAFIDLLEENGYEANTPDDMVDMWLTILCRNIALEELQGTGDFDEDADKAVELKRTRLNDGTVEVK